MRDGHQEKSEVATAPPAGSGRVRLAAAHARQLWPCERRHRLRRLGEELRKTNRRVNALENIVIPDYNEQIKFIQMSLEERAREDIFRLKKVKKALERKEAARMERLKS